MNILILSVVFLFLFISGLYQTLRCFKADPVPDNRKKMSLAVIAAASAFVLMELVSGADTAAMLAFELSVCLFILYVMTVSVAGIRKLYLVPVLLSALAVVRILCMSERGCLLPCFFSDLLVHICNCLSDYGLQVLGKCRLFCPSCIFYSLMFCQDNA